ncbi:MAG: hypothetical protein JWR19_2820 [Pedosphaera sp.]|nr:hypothetical protein [Pedosphaera sp.]
MPQRGQTTGLGESGIKRQAGAAAAAFAARFIPVILHGGGWGFLTGMMMRVMFT